MEVVWTVLVYYHEFPRPVWMLADKEFFGQKCRKQWWKLT